MRRPTMIAIGSVAVLVVAWVLLMRTPAPPARQPTVVTAPAPAPITPPPVDPPATTPAPVALPPSPAAEPPPVEPEPQADAAAKAEPPAGEDATADTTDAAAEDEAPTDEESGPQPIDAEHAADLMADWIASQEAAGVDDPEKMDKVLKTFDDEGAGDPEWSEAAEKKVEAVLDEWLAGLPEEARQHIELLSVECRITLCQILGAGNDTSDQQTQDWLHAMVLLQQQPWWHEFGFVDTTTSMRGNTETGYLLYQTYLMREAPPQAE